MKWAIVKDNKIHKVYSGENNEAAYGRLARPPYAEHIQIPVDIENEDYFKYENGNIIVNTAAKDKSIIEAIRAELLQRRAAKRQLANNLMDIVNAHIDDLNLTEAQEDAIDNALAKLEKGRPDRIKARIESQNVNAVFTQELKDALLYEFERVGL